MGSTKEIWLSEGGGVNMTSDRGVVKDMGVAVVFLQDMGWDG